MPAGNLQIIGAQAHRLGTYSAANGVINFTTNGTILGLSGNTTYLTTANLIANVSGQSVAQQPGGVSTATVALIRFTVAPSPEAVLSDPGILLTLVLTPIMAATSSLRRLLSVVQT